VSSVYLSSCALISCTTKSSETAGFLFPGRLAIFLLCFDKDVRYYYLMIAAWVRTMDGDGFPVLTAPRHPRETRPGQQS
jgi:hypothetical protein